MKRLLPLCLLAAIFLALHTKPTTAQITGLSMWFASDTSYNACTLPATATVSLGGGVTGTPGLNDSVTIYVNYGTGNDTTFKIAFQQIYFNANYSRIHTLPGTFTTMVVASFGSFTDTIYSKPLTYSNSCQALSGRVYMDGNNNCTYDTGEQPLSWRMVKITNTSTNVVTHAFTDSVGMYHANLPQGTYNIEPQFPGVNISPSCPTTGQTTLTINLGPYTENFAYNCNPAAAVDLGTHGFSAGFRPGFNRPLYVYTTSTNLCATQPATLTVVLDPMLSYTSTANGTAPTVTGSNLVWNFTSLSGLYSSLSTLNIFCATTANVGDTACITFTITTTANDTNSANDTYTLCVPIRNSFDPNDKHVSPMGRESAGYIQNNIELTYLVNFQNTGNDTAYDVTVKDVIDANLDMSTLKILDASHPMIASLIADNEIAFRFDNINLPDSNINEPASHGFVLYAIRPKQGLTPGTTINNTANIYFDYNSAIITNTTLNTIDFPTAIQHISRGALKAAIYPNPAREQLHIKTEGAANFEAAMFDVLGRCVQMQQGHNSEASFDVRNVANGMYLVKISSEGKELSVRINVQH